VTEALSGGLSVIIPVLHEERRIAPALERVCGVAGIAEIIVVDGGSSDATVAEARAIAARRRDVRILHAARGRGSQMNAGARVANGEVLLFLHADATLPANAAQWIAHALAKPDVVAGAFRLRTVADGPRAWLAPLLRLADLRSRVTRLPYGDQAVFVRRDAFERAGGFPEQPLMEDLELALRLRKLGRIEIVPAVVEVSGRRFLARPLTSAIVMRLFPLLYRLGVPPRLLAQLYGNPR
jgi:rSAM/selenodomain-associated transferase 2